MSLQGGDGQAFEKLHGVVFKVFDDCVQALGRGVMRQGDLRFQLGKGLGTALGQGVERLLMSFQKVFVPERSGIDRGQQLRGVFGFGDLLISALERLGDTSTSRTKFISLGWAGSSRRSASLTR